VSKVLELGPYLSISATNSRQAVMRNPVKRTESLILNMKCHVFLKVIYRNIGDTQP
jgi:hypothetical protein